MATKQNKSVEVQPELTQNDLAELKVYRAFQNSYAIKNLYESTSNKFTLGDVTFTNVFTNVDEGHDDEEPQDRYSVWQVDDLYIKLEGTINSYGTTYFEGWKFVKPKEKLVVVYE